MKNKFKLLFFAIFIFTLLLSVSNVCASDLDNSTIGLMDNENDLSHIENSHDLEELQATNSDSSNGVSSKEVYVDYNRGNDDNSGSDWNNAFKTIEKSLESVEDDGVIHVAEGVTYLSDSTGAEGININQKVSIIGQNVNSIISGNNNKRIFSIGLNAEVFISNLTLTDGYSSDGGAIYIESGSAISYGKLTMSNSVISNCYATSRGGAISSNMGSISDINNVTFVNDRSVSNGGAISIQQKGSLSNINDCKFINNSASNRGGAIYLGTGSTCSIGDNNLFERNKALDRYGYGGAIHGANGISLGTGNIFVNNFAEKGGSALSALNSKDITGSFCFFINNTAADSSIIYGSKVAVTFENCYWGSNTPLFSDFVYNQNAWAPENYLVLSILANDSVISGNQIPIVVDLSKNQNNQNVDLSNLPKDISIVFSAVNGDFDISSPKFLNGIATANYIAKNAGNDTITVDIHGAVSTLGINVLAKRGTVFVNYTGGLDSNDGAGWSSAVKTISHALSIVGDDNPIYVASGVNYLDDADVNGLLISKDTSIIGVGDNVILDAKNIGRIFYIDGFALSLSNLIFANANVSNANDQRGGVIWANNSILNVDNCKFINNTAGNANSYGGAINLKYSIADISQSSFENNAAWYAGGAINAEITNVLLNISHSVFTNNKILNNGWSTGAAICSYNTVNIFNSVFYNNTLTDKTRKGKSVNQYRDGSLTIKNSVLLDGDSSVHVANISTASLEDNWWGNNNSNKDISPTLSYTNGNVNSYRILKTSLNQEIVHVGDLVTVATSLNRNQNGDVLGDLPDLPIVVDAALGTVIPNVTSISNELSSIYNATVSGEEVITVDVLGINNEMSFFVKKAMPKISISDVITPWSLGVYPGVINYFDIKLTNNENARIDNITIELLSNESDEQLGSYVGALDKGSSTISIIDHTIREINEKSIWPGAQDNNLIKFIINVKYDGEIISSFSADKILAYNGYFNKTYVYGGHDNVINRNYTINGDIIVSTQDVSVYGDQFTLFRNETWNIETPDDAEIVKVLLYFNYNWDTSFFPDGWTLEFNGHNILEEYMSHEIDRGNLGIWGAYNYGLLVFDVTDYYNVNANNSFIINKTKYCALYPSTLYVLYNLTESDNIKDVYFSDICDVFYPLYNPDGYDDLLKFVVNFNNIDLTNLHQANWYVFTGSSSLNNKLSFNNMTISNPFVNYSPNDCRPVVYNVTNLINQNNEVWFISTPESSTTVAYEQVLVVERGINTTIELDFNNLTLLIGSNVTISPIVTPVRANVTYICNDTTVATIDENGMITAIKSGKALITVIAGDGVKYPINSTNFTLTVSKIDSSIAVDVNDINVGEVAGFVISGLPSDATGNVTVIVGGKSNSAVVSNGECIVEISGLKEGNYQASISYSGDVKYNPISDSKNIAVFKNNPHMNVSTNNIKYGDIATFEVILPSDATGTVTVNVGSKSANKTIKNGKATVEIEGLTKGDYYYNITYSGDDKYVSATQSNMISVGKTETTFAVDSVNDINVDDSINFVISGLPTDASGKITVTVNNGQLNSSNVVDGKAFISIKMSVEGSFYAKVSYSNDEKYMANAVDVTFNVNKISAGIGVNVSDINVGDSANFVVYGLPSDATGNVTVSVDGKSQSARCSNGKATISVVGLAFGSKTATVFYTGDYKYNSVEVSKQFSVNKVNPSVSVAAPAIDYGSDAVVTVTVPSDASGEVTITVDGNDYVGTIEDSKVTFAVSGLTAGTKVLDVKYGGDGKYNEKSISYSFEVNKVSAALSVDAPAVDYGYNSVVTVNLPSDATGMVTVTVNGKYYNATVKNAMASVSVGKLNAGSHDVAIVYNGDSNYVKTNVSDSITVNKIVPAMTVAVGDINVDESAVFNVTLPDDANGRITVSINGGKSTSTNVVNGKVDISIKMSAEGSYTAKVIYSDDENYIDDELNVTFNVNKIKTTIHVTVNNISVGESAVIVVFGLPSDAAGEVTVTVDGESYSTNVSNGNAIANVSGLSGGSKDAVVIYYGDEKYLSSTVNKTFVVSKIVPSMSVSADNNISVGDVAEFGVVLPSDASGSVTISVDGNSVSGDVSKGHVYINISDLTEGFKEAVVSYSGDEKYVNATSSVYIEVNAKFEPITPSLNVTLPSEVSVGDTPAVKVSLPIDAKGNVTIKLDGNEISDLPLDNGTISVPLSNLSVGNHTVEIIYSGDEKYLSESSIESITVKKKATHIKVVASFTRLATDYFAGERGANYKGYLLDENNKPVVNRIVKITVNGVTYKVETNKNGVFYLRINLNTAKVYPMKVTFNGDDVYLKAPVAKTKLTVIKKSTSIKASNKVFKAKTKNKKIKITLKTVKNKYNGKTYLKKGKKITLRVNGKTYTAKTNAKGVAKFSIKLKKKGNFRALIKFKGDKTYKACSKKIMIKIKR